VTRPPASGTETVTLPPASGTTASPFTLLGDPDALACEGDACALP
jgi:hypothetical protein